MNEQRSWRRLAMSAAVSLLMLGMVAGCVNDDDDPTGDVDECPAERSYRCPDDTCVEKSDACEEPSSCPAERSYRCPDDTCAENADACEESPSCPAQTPYRCPDESCAADAASCPGSQPDEIDGEIVRLSPQTVLGHAPEKVEVRVKVSDVDRVEQLVDDGATWRVELETLAGVESLDADVTRDDSSDEFDYVAEFTPPTFDAPAGVGVSVVLDSSTQGSTCCVYSWGEGKRLRVRGDASTLEFDGRESFRLEGVQDAARVWSGDLDGDGQADLVVSDIHVEVEKVERVLRVFACDQDQCEPVGTTRGGIDVPTGGTLVDVDGANPDEPGGFLGVQVNDRTATGALSEIDVVWLQIAEDSGQRVLKETRETIDMQRAAGGFRLHEQTLQPHLLLDQESGQYRPSVSITRTIDGVADSFWSTVLIDSDGVFADFQKPRGFEGLDEQQRNAAVQGQVSSCPAPGSVGQTGQNPPEGMLISAFEDQGQAMLAVGPIDPNEAAMQSFVVDDHFDRALFEGEYGSAKCELVDLDGDGFPELVVALGDSDTYTRLGEAGGRAASLLVTRGIDKKDIRRGVVAPSLLIEDIDADDWKVAASGSFSISKRSARTGRNPQTGKEIKIATKLSFDLDAPSGIDVTITNSPPVPGGVSFFDPDDDGDGVLTLLEGNDRVVCKRPGRTANGDISLDRGLDGSTQLFDDEGSIVLARLAPTLTEGEDGEALLVPTDPDELLAWLSSTGPFIPLQMPDSNPNATPALKDIVAIPSGDGADKSTPKLIEALVNDEGVPTSVVTGEIILEEDRQMVTTEHTFDTSQVELQGKNVVKFKAGAELSGQVNLAGPGGSDNCVGDCPVPDAVLIGLELDTGEIVMGVIDPGSGDDVELHYTGMRDEVLAGLGLDETDDLSGVSTALRIGHDRDGQPLLILHGLNVVGDDLDEVDETFVTIGHRKALAGTPASRKGRASMMGDVSGTGVDQRVECRVSANDIGDRALECRSSHLSNGDDGDADWRGPFVAAGNPVAVIDVDGDGCADLVTDAGEYLSSRCDGSFEPVAVELGPWSSHVPVPAGLAAHSKNSSRSNKTEGISDGGDTSSGPALPFFDGLTLPLW
jgi:nucleoid DNA-binding protein